MMYGIIGFVCGLFLGVFLGMLLTAMLTANKLHDHEYGVDKTAENGDNNE